MRFKLVSYTQDGAHVGDSAHARVQPSVLPIERYVMQGLLLGWIAHADSLLNEVNVQHGHHGKGRRPLLSAGAGDWISNNSSAHGNTGFISSKIHVYDYAWWVD